MEPTAKQIVFIEKLGGLPELVTTKHEASLYLDELIAEQKAQVNELIVEGKAFVLDPGVYKHNGEIYQVKPNKQKTGVYAKRLIEIGGKRLTEAGPVQKIEFVYAPGVVNEITEDEKLPIDEAKELTIRYGRCLMCGRGLKDAKSVEAGIGPVCAKAFAPVPHLEPVA